MIQGTVTKVFTYNNDDGMFNHAITLDSGNVYYFKSKFKNPPTHEGAEVVFELYKEGSKSIAFNTLKQVGGEAKPKGGARMPFKSAGNKKTSFTKDTDNVGMRAGHAYSNAMSLYSALLSAGVVKPDGVEDALDSIDKLAESVVKRVDKFKASLSKSGATSSGKTELKQEDVTEKKVVETKAQFDL